MFSKANNQERSSDEKPSLASRMTASTGSQAAACLTEAVDRIFENGQHERPRLRLTVPAEKLQSTDSEADIRLRIALLGNHLLTSCSCLHCPFHLEQRCGKLLAREYGRRNEKT